MDGGERLLQLTGFQWQKNKEAGPNKKKKKIQETQPGRTGFLIKLKRALSFVSNGASEDLTLKTLNFKGAMMG